MAVDLYITVNKLKIFDNKLNVLFAAKYRQHIGDCVYLLGVLLPNINNLQVKAHRNVKFVSFFFNSDWPNTDKVVTLKKSVLKI